MVAEETKPSLLELARRNNTSPGPTCRFVGILASHPRSAEVTELLDACSSKEIRYSTAQEVLETVGIKASADSISRHCRRLCSCRS